MNEFERSHGFTNDRVNIDDFENRTLFYFI